MQVTPIYGANFSFKGRSVVLTALDASVGSKLSALLGLPIGAYAPIRDAFHLGELAGRFVLQTGKECQFHDTLNAAIIALTKKIPHALIRKRPLYVLHAAAFVVGEKAHLLVGSRYIGKSTLAFEAWSAGFELIGDDLLLLDPATATVQATPKPLKIRIKKNALPNRLAGSVSPEDYCLGQFEESWELVLGRGLPRMIPLDRGIPIGGIYLIERTDEASSICAPAERQEFMQAMYKHLLSAPQHNLDILRGLSGLFGQGRVSEAACGAQCGRRRSGGGRGESRSS